jgi:hypothetical protein
MYKKLISNKIFWLFLLVHLILINVNYAEWGDTYRILRASEFIREFNYPKDEKRPPLFSFFLTIRPENIDQIAWGRVEMFVFSLFSFVTYFYLLNELKLENKTKNLSLLLFTLNPVFLYWSLRIYADVPFTLLALLFFFLVTKWQSTSEPRKLFLIGVVTGLAILTRYEGYLLAASYVLALLAKKEEDYPNKLRKVLIFGFAVLMIVAPWLLYKNPLKSKYLSEPEGRAYDLRMVIIYFTSLIYLFGFTSAFYFLMKKTKKIKDFLVTNRVIAIFLALELLLALLWPAAIPRLFVPTIPFLIILLAKSINDYFDVKEKPALSDLLVLGGLLVLYLLMQYWLRLQFLILLKPLLLIAIVIQFAVIGAIFFNNYSFFKITMTASLLIWSLASIWLHKDIFRAVVDANLYVVDHLQGKIAYNDVSSVSDWYLNRRRKNNGIVGTYLNMDAREGRSAQNLRENAVDYVMITNEHNPTLEFSPEETNYLEEIKEFRYTIRGTEFFTKILKFTSNE